MPRHERIRKKVSELLKANGIRTLPIPVETIAWNLGVEIKYEPAEDSLSGALVRNRKQVVIGVNSAHHSNRQRFTIAHEIGHFVLHRGIKLHVDEDFRVNLRDGSSSVEEMEANAFAAELLMPASFMDRETRKLGRIDEQGKKRLARRFQVSVMAMEIRLANLGLAIPV